MQSKQKKKPANTPTLIFKIFASIICMLYTVSCLYQMFNSGDFSLAILVLFFFFVFVLICFPTELFNIFSDIWKSFRKKKNIIPPHLIDITPIMLFLVTTIIGIPCLFGIMLDIINKGFEWGFVPLLLGIIALTSFFYYTVWLKFVTF